MAEAQLLCGEYFLCFSDICQKRFILLCLCLTSLIIVLPQEYLGFKLANDEFSQTFKQIFCCV